MSKQDNPFEKLSEDQIIQFVKDNSTDHDLVEMALQAHGNALEHLDESSKVNMNLVAAAYAQNKGSIQYAREEHKTNVEYIDHLANTTYPDTVAKRDRALNSNEDSMSNTSTKTFASLSNLIKASVNMLKSFISASASALKNVFSSSKDGAGKEGEWVLNTEGSSKCAVTATDLGRNMQGSEANTEDIHGLTQEPKDGDREGYSGGP